MNGSIWSVWACWSRRVDERNGTARIARRSMGGNKKARVVVERRGGIGYMIYMIMEIGDRATLEVYGEGERVFLQISGKCKRKDAPRIGKNGCSYDENMTKFLFAS